AWFINGQKAASNLLNDALYAYLLDVTWCQNAASHCDSARYPQALERLAFQYKHQPGCELRDDWQWGFVVVHIYLHSRGMSAATSPM
ncbi:MAG: hypothetical protein WCH75_09615, partial [Candidatus Binatia bacterium]